MSNTYRTVEELTVEEFEQLKYAYYDQLVCDGEDVLDGMGNWQDIPDEVIVDHYAGIMFTDEDFFCNIREDEEDQDEAIERRFQLETEYDKTH